MRINVGLGGIFLSDFLCVHLDPSLKDFISSENELGKEEEELIRATVEIAEKGHPEYKGIGLRVDLLFKRLVVNFKPETLAKVLLFI